MRRLFLLIMLLLLGKGIATSRSHYATVHNAFSRLQSSLKSRESNEIKWQIDQEFLTIDNRGHHVCMLIDSTEIGNDFSYTVRASLTGNRPGKRNQGWGIVFNYWDSANYCYTTIQFDNNTPVDDIAGNRHATISLFQCIAGYHRMLARHDVAKGVDLYDGINTLQVNCSDGNIRIGVGKNKLQVIESAKIAPTDGNASVGIMMDAGTTLSVERAVLSYGTKDVPHPTLTTWTEEALDQQFAISDDPIEGYWTYQDRDMEEKWLRMGGRYTIAIVSASSGYDIIYIAGGQVNASAWSPGMLKGHIDKTIFDGHYDLEWLDSNFEVIKEDAFASFENGVLFTLHFPVYKSQVRFSKILKP